MREVKGWELRLIADKLKDNSYIVWSAGQSFLCKKVGSDYLVQNKDQTKLTIIDSVTKL